MQVASVDIRVQEGIDLVQAGLDLLAAADLTPADVHGAAALIRSTEAIGRRVDAVQTRVVAAIDHSGLYAVDGHGSAKVMVRHLGHLADGEAARRDRRVRMLRTLPQVAEAFAGGRIGTCQVDRIAKVHANPRVREQLAGLDGHLAVAAARLPHRELHLLLANWEQLTDEDGTRDRNQLAQENRDVRLVQEFDLSWTLDGRCGAFAGAELRTVLDHHVAAETAVDWEKARATHGDQATYDDLPRTESQRRFDALQAIFQAAVAATAAEPGGTRVTTDVVIDGDTYARELQRISGEQPAPRCPDLDLIEAAGTPPKDASDADSHDAPDPAETPPDAVAGADSQDAPDRARRTGFRCDTIDGWRLEPTEAVATSLLAHVRRVVIGADGTVIDLGRSRRLFTGSAHLAAVLGATGCYWPGCNTTARRCQVDHLHPWGQGGSTDQQNAGLLCGRHNRLKERGYTVSRDPTGEWEILRPDGTPLE